MSTATRSVPCIAAILLLAAPTVRAQELPDTVHLARTLVVGTRSTDLPSGTKVQEIDSATLARFRSANLGDLLSSGSPVFVKSYGPGTLATTSFRGGSASQTAILWNGFNIGSPMNGQIDLSLVPMRIANEASIRYGGMSALSGSGAVGGTVLLNNVPSFDKGIRVDAGAVFGSFGDRRQDIGISRSTANWASSISLYNSAARNDFSYRNTTEPGAPLRVQQHADVALSGLLAENHYRINARERINARFWYQTGNRDIPPTMTQEASTANQRDGSCRLTTEWQRTGDRARFNARAGYFTEKLEWYRTPDVPADLSRSRQLIAEAQMKVRPWPRNVINVGLNNTFTEALSDGYRENHRQDRAALFASYRYDTKDQRSNTTLSARQEMVDGQAVPFTFSLGSEYTCAKWLTAKGGVSKVYRLPTFNDLYWVPGGNPALMPESGYSAEAGVVLAWEPRRTGMAFTTELTLFNRDMENWIAWVPGPVHWSPENIMDVWSRGLESRSDISIRANKTLVKLSVLTNYVVSTNGTAKTANDASVDKQLIYVPVYSGHAQLTVSRKSVAVVLGLHYTGYRFTSTDNRAYLPPYTLADMAVTYTITHGDRCSVHLMAQGFNLFDETYQVMLTRAMPLRNYQFGLRIQFDRPNKQRTEDR